MILWKQVRIPLLALTCGSVFLVLGKVILAPNPNKFTAAAFTFPPQVPLPEWQLQESRPLAEPTASHPNLITGRYYQYSQKGFPLNIEMRYLVGTGGETKDLIEEYSSFQPSVVSRQKNGVGFYGLLVHQQRAYLSACINPRGGSTATGRQFTQNRRVYDVHWSRVLPWLLGQQPLVDSRCLWAYLSIPIEGSSPEKAYQTLEKAWFYWYQWWQPRFPKP